MSLRGPVKTLTVRLKVPSLPKKLCGVEAERDRIVFTLHFIGLGRGTGAFNFWTGNPPF